MSQDIGDASLVVPPWVTTRTFEALDLGRLDLGSSTALGPTVTQVLRHDLAGANRRRSVAGLGSW